MKTLAFVLATGLLLTTPAWSAQHCDDAEATMQEHHEVKELFREISMLNLVNALHLRQEQMRQLLPLAEQAKALREKYKYGGRIDLALQEAKAAYTALRDEIRRTGHPAEGDVSERAVRIEHRLLDMVSEGNKRVMRELEPLEAQVGEILTPEQLQIVETFKPCIVPPQDLGNPVRAGQASSNERFINHLRKVRAMPEDLYQIAKYDLIEHAIEKYTHFRCNLTEEEKKAEAERILGVLDRARELSDVDFEMEKETLAPQVRIQDKIDELRDELERRSPRVMKEKSSRLARYFLAEELIPVLKERLGVVAKSD